MSARPYTRWTPAMEAEVIRLRGEGKRMWQIAEALGVGRSAVTNRCNRLLEAGRITPLENVKRGFVNAIDRFWARVDKAVGPSGCWIWTGRLRADGRGVVGFEVAGLSPDSKTHRVAYYLTHGNLPAAPLVLRHTCDNAPCCNPSHLIPGTYRENAMDCVLRGRHPTKGKKMAQVSA